MCDTINILTLSDKQFCDFVDSELAECSGRRSATLHILEECLRRLKRANEQITRSDESPSSKPNS